MMKKKSLLSAAICISLLSALPGCGRTEEEAAPTSAEITLLDPVNAAASVEKATYRDLRKAKVYGGIITPEVTDYSFGENVTLDSYQAYPGDTVQEGDVLAKADSTGILEQIESVAETVEELDRQQNYALDDYETAIAKIDEELAWPYYRRALLNGAVNEDLEYQISLLENRKQGILLDQEQKTALYELDRIYYEEQLERLQAQESSRELLADRAGTVAAIGNYSQGSWIEGNSQLTAVVQDSSLLLQCEYISQQTLNSYQEIYAIVNGCRYEVTSQPYSNAAYQKLLAQNETLYSYFSLEDAEGVLQAGDYAVLVGVSERLTQVLSLSNEALHKDGTETFVYRMQDGTSVSTPVRTGFNDGAYTEILEGLSAQEEVLLPQYSSSGEYRTDTVRMGSFSWGYTGSGYMTYPVNTYVKNPVEHGTVYLTKYYVEQYEHVEAGDVIATVQVVTDDVLLAEKQRRLERLQERLAELTPEETSAIARKQDQIDELLQEIAELQRDAAVTELTAQTSGMVIWLAELQEGALLQTDMDIAQIADESRCYIMVQNEDNQLNYGNTVTFEYTDRDEQLCTAEGKVVTLATQAAPVGLKADYVCVLPPAEVIRNMSTVKLADSGDYYTRVVFSVSTLTRVMDHVLIVPKTAVTETGGQTYVNVMNEDGTVTARSFLAGGSNGTSYWVAEGLEEGTIICLE